MALASAMNMSGTAASRPAASIAGRTYTATDTLAFSYDTGSTWIAIGGAGALTLITDTTVSGSAAANIDFASIPGTYKHLRLVGQVRGDTSANHIALRLTVNADTTAAHYEWNYAETYSGNTANGTDSGSDTSLSVGNVCAATTPASWPGSFELDVPNYAGTTFFKTTIGVYGYGSGGGTGGILCGTSIGFWLSTAAITELKFSPATGNFVIGSRISLYGVN